MDNSLDMIHGQVKKIKESLLVQLIENPNSFVSPSAYDTAWLAMVGDPKTNNEKPMFRVCLDWILSIQKEEGFWGERDCYGKPTIDSLPSTLACMVALKMWDWDHEHIEKGMAFLRKNVRKLLKREGNDDKAYPRWFAIVFPGMVEIARQRGLQDLFEEDEIKNVVERLFFQQRDIFQTENLVNKYQNHPLLSYLEVLPSSYHINEATIINYLCDDGSLSQSPAASVAAYNATRNPKTMSYLCNLVQNHSGGVPSMYPIDEGCIKLYMVNHLQRLGLSNLFEDEIKVISDDIYREYIKQEESKQDFVQANVFKRSLAFEVLRNQGYKVSPWMFSRRLLTDDYALQHIQDNHEMHSSMMYNVYRATNLMFESEEEEMKGLRSFSRRLLEHSRLSSRKSLDDGSIMWPHLQETIKRELLVPWMARMDHLDHRAWIEANMDSPLFLGKASFYRISCLDNKDLLQLAKYYYEYQQMVYKKELVELLRWSKEWGIPNMGFARDKTTYCYFAIASSSSLPYDTDIRLIVAKSAVIITIFDDFFDTEGSLDELEILAKAIQRWDNTGLRTQSKALFDVLDDFVGDTAKKFFEQHQIDITNHLRNIWCEVVDSWLTEATWSKTGKIPTKASYIEIGMISIAAHTLVLQASCFLTSTFSPRNLNPSKYEVITKLLMTACRLLNDIKSYEKEVKDGKINSVLLHLKENAGANMEDAVDYVENILEGTKMRLLEHALMDDETGDEMPRSCKMLHLHALKVFQMFFNSGNHFDSKDSLLNDINKAIFVPFEEEDHTSLELDNNNPPKMPLKLPSTKKKILLTVNSSQFCTINLKNYGRSTKLTMKQTPLAAMPIGSFQSRMKIAPSCSFRFAC